MILTKQSIQKTHLWTALVVPTHQDGRVDFDGVRSLVKKQANTGNGIRLLVSTAQVKGLVSAAANIWLKATKRYIEFAIAAQFLSLFSRWQHTVEVLFQVSNTILIKLLMHQKGSLAVNTLSALLTEKAFLASHRLKEFEQTIIKYQFTKSNHWS